MAESPWQPPDLEPDAERRASARRSEALRARKIAVAMVLSGAIALAVMICADQTYLAGVGMVLCLGGYAKMVLAERKVRAERGLSRLLRPVSPRARRIEAWNPPEVDPVAEIARIRRERRRYYLLHGASLLLVGGLAFWAVQSVKFGYRSRDEQDLFIALSAVIALSGVVQVCAGLLYWRGRYRRAEFLVPIPTVSHVTMGVGAVVGLVAAALKVDVLWGAAPSAFLMGFGLLFAIFRPR
ncbi:MAG: hypothetical protein AAF488_09970 [Planctomycetota bacterium]